MVVVGGNHKLHRRALHRRFARLDRSLGCCLGGIFLIWIWMTARLAQDFTHPSDSMKRQTWYTKESFLGTCDAHPPLSISESLTKEQRNPTLGHRWMVTPPQGGNLHLMCCDTTKGSFHILLHEAWAPIGVPHLLRMLQKGYFDTEIPLFRCTDACQFGLSANASLTKEFDRPSIQDDPLWLPTGPKNRFSSNNATKKMKRYPKGVLTHAGSGKNSRGVQFVLTLKPNKFMGGGSPWEVPLGEVVEPYIKPENDKERYGDVYLPDLYTGYGENGPGQGLLHRKGVDDEVREKWPLLDYVLRCSIVDQLLVDNR